jgi:hypothetical protein
MGRSPCCEKAHTNRGAWTKEEDERLVAYVRAHGEGCWRSLPRAAGLLRCGKSCRLRWINYLRPDLKRGNFTADEDDLIVKLHSLLGNKYVPASASASLTAPPDLTQPNQASKLKNVLRLLPCLCLQVVAHRRAAPGADGQRDQELLEHAHPAQAAVQRHRPRHAPPCRGGRRDHHLVPAQPQLRRRRRRRSSSAGADQGRGDGGRQGAQVP